MGAGQDINGKYAQSWSNVDLSKIQSVSANSPKDKLLQSIKKIIEQQTKSIRSNKNDDKYRSIVDLIMLRVRSSIDSFVDEIDFNEIDIDSLEDAIVEKTNQATAKLYQNSSQISIVDFVDLVDEALSQYLGKQIDQTDQSAGQHTDIDSTVSLSTEYDKKSIDADISTSIELQSALQQVKLNIDAQFKKLFNLCQSSFIVNQSTIEVKPHIKKRQTSTKAPLTKTTSAIKKLQAKITPTPIIQRKQKNVDKQNQSIGMALPSSISTSVLYKYNKSIFIGLPTTGVVSIMNMLNKLDKYKKTTIDAFDRLHATVDAYYKPIIEMANAIKKSVRFDLINFIFEQLLWRSTTDFLKPILNALKKAIWNLLPDWIQKAITAIVDTVKAFFQALKSAFKMLVKGLRKVTRWIKNLVSKIFSPLFKAFKGIVSSITRAISGLVKMVWKAVRMLTSVLTFIGKFIYGAIRFVGKLFSKTGIGKLFKTIWSKISKGFKRIKGAIKKIGGRIAKVFKNMKNAIGKAFNGMKNGMKNGIKRLGKAIKNVIKKVVKKVFTVVKNTVKKIVSKIMKKLGINIAKKVAKKKAKSLLMMGAKKILGFFKKWVVKFIAKFAAKILGAAAVNAIPILGQIISVCMMVYTIVDTICMFWDVYKFMKETPEAWDFMKEKVAEWASKAFNFIDDLLKLGKKLFQKIFIDGPKALAKGAAHVLNFLLSPFASSKKIAKEAKYIKELDEIKTNNFNMLKAMPEDKRKDFIQKKGATNLKNIEKHRPAVDKLSSQIQKEQDSWWPSNDKILQWMDERQWQFRSMMHNATEIGLPDFSPQNCAEAKGILEKIEKEEAEKKRILAELAKHRKEMKVKYGNKQIDIAKLQEICKQQFEKQNQMNEQIEELTKEIGSQSNTIIDILDTYVNGDDIDDDENQFNSFQDDIDTLIVA